jgi:tripartite-type tricarboxylate transporter receptor subunit TctC
MPPIRVFLAVATAFAALSASAQEFPQRPVKIIFPFPAGNTLDTMVRMVGDWFREATGQPFVYEYKPGAAGVIAAQTVLAAPADGYTLALGTSGQLAINPHTFSRLPYDTFKDFVPVAHGVGAQFVFTGSTQAPGSTLAEFIAYAKANPGKTNFASFTPGNPSHFAGVILNQLAGIDMQHIGYKGTPPAMQDLLGAQVMTGFMPLIAVKPHVDGGKLKVFAVTGSTRSPLLPGVPTFKELGFSRMEIYGWGGFVARAGTPAAAVQRLNAEIAAALRAPEAQQKLRAMDLEPFPGTPDDFARAIRADYERWESAVKSSGFRAD